MLSPRYLEDIMIRDKELILSDEQAITVGAKSTNIVNLGAVTSKIQAYFKKGSSRLLVSVVEAFTKLTSLTISLRTASAYSGESTDGTLTTGLKTVLSKTILLADLVPGQPLIDQELPMGMLQYCDLDFEVTGSAPDAGTINAEVILETQSNGM